MSLSMNGSKYIWELDLIASPLAQLSIHPQFVGMRNSSVPNLLSCPLILDGGLSNVLEGMGCDLNHKLWTAEVLISQPELIVQAHLKYLEAGAHCISTAGYQASIQGFRDLGFDITYIEELLLKPVALAREAIKRYSKRQLISRPLLVAASIGPYGAYLADGSEYRGHYGLSDVELRHFHQRRIELLDNAEADLLAIETIPSFQEAQVLAELLNHCHTRSWISFSCKDGAHLNDGTPLAEACQILAPVQQIFGIGVNCTAPNHVSSLIRTIKEHAPSKKVVIYPNSGEVFNPSNKTWKGTSIPEDFASQAMHWVNEGADMIGGCCRIGPGHIKEISTSLSKTDE